jgi:microcin C transport system substrate-binding protein
MTADPMTPSSEPRLGRTRPAIAGAAVALIMALGLHTGTALAQDPPVAPSEPGGWRHASALTGTPQYPADFPHFDYVNPDAPKGGTLRLSSTGSFDTLNPLPARGDLPAGLNLVYETLMTPSEDEINAQYGLIAEGFRHPDDFSSVTFLLRDEAAWHDGTPITPEDVVWSFEKSTELNPQMEFYYQHVTAAEVTGEREVTFTFDEANNRELPQIVGQLMVLPRHWWEGEDAQGRQRNIAATTLEAPLGSGPYRIASLSAGSTITFERVPDHWARDLPVNVGQNNFDRISYTFYADRNVEFTAFTGNNSDFWMENEARRWATAYEFPAAQDGRVIREEIENPYRARADMVAFVPNLRREKFQDARVRRALNLAFDFEELRRTIFYDQYERIDSFFFGSELASSGLPEGAELDILETVRDDVPPTVFTEPYTNPVGGSTQAQRDNLGEAVRLFNEAGYEIRSNRMVNVATGEAFSFEILLNGPIIERVALPYVERLLRIGVAATVRTVEPSQYINRQRARDFDMIYTGWPQSLSPGNEQLEFFGSRAADREGSQNHAGIKDPAVDALIRRIIFATDRDELVAATKAMDRVLLANNYVIPTYSRRTMPIAYWDKFGRPDELPYYSLGFPGVWWSKDAESQPAQEG